MPTNTKTQVQSLEAAAAKCQLADALDNTDWSDLHIAPQLWIIKQPDPANPYYFDCAGLAGDSFTVEVDPGSPDYAKAIKKAINVFYALSSK